MTAERFNVAKQIQALEGEESMIEAHTIHEGFRDASRHNRIDVELSALRDTLRRTGQSFLLHKKNRMLLSLHHDADSQRDAMRTILLSFRNLQVKH